MIYRFYFIGDIGSQNMFVHHLARDTLKLKKEKGADYVLSWKSDLVYISKLKLLYIAYLHSIKSSGYRVRTNLM